MNSNNLLKDKYPEIFAQIDIEKTLQEYPGLDINNISSGTDLNIFWKCSKYSDHIWQSAVYNRTSKHKSGCPYCAGRKVLSGFNDLQSKFPNIAEEFCIDLNGITPDKVYYAGSKKYFWRCSKHSEHIWEAVIRTRTQKNLGCPICSNQKILTGYNDLQTKFPEIAKEFASDLNGITPDKVLYGSGKRYYWRCLKNPNHVWQTETFSRTSRDHTKCPFCGSKHSTPEILFHELCQKYVDNSSINSYNYNSWEFDEYIPKYKCFFEYDGENFHSSGQYLNKKKREILKIREITKNNLAISNHYRIIRIRESRNISEIIKGKEIIDNAEYYYINTISGYNIDYFKRYSEIFYEIFGIEVNYLEIQNKYWEIKQR